MRRHLPRLTVSVLLVLAGLVLGRALGATAAAPAPVPQVLDLVDGLERAALALSPGGPAAPAAVIDGVPIPGRLFDLKYGLLLKNAPDLTDEQRTKLAGDPEYRGKMLKSLVYTRVLMRAAGADRRLAADHEYYLFLASALADAAQKYYLVKASAGIAVGEVTDKEIEDLYNQLKENPQSRERMAGMPFDKVKELLKNELLQRRRQAKVMEIVEKLVAASKVTYGAGK